MNEGQGKRRGGKKVGSVTGGAGQLSAEPSNETKDRTSRSREASSSSSLSLPSLTSSSSPSMSSKPSSTSADMSLLPHDMKEHVSATGGGGTSPSQSVQPQPTTPSSPSHIPTISHPHITYLQGTQLQHSIESLRTSQQSGVPYMFIPSEQFAILQYQGLGRGTGVGFPTGQNQALASSAGPYLQSEKVAQGYTHSTSSFPSSSSSSENSGSMGSFTSRVKAGTPMLPSSVNQLQQLRQNQLEEYLQAQYKLQQQQQQQQSLHLQVPQFQQPLLTQDPLQHHHQFGVFENRARESARAQLSENMKRTAHAHSVAASRLQAQHAYQPSLAYGAGLPVEMVQAMTSQRPMMRQVYSPPLLPLPETGLYLQPPNSSQQQVTSSHPVGSQSAVANKRERYAEASEQELKMSKRRRKKRGSTSTYRGVSWHKRDEKWVARVWGNGNVHNIGNFETELRAAVEVDEKILSLCAEGKEAGPPELNFPCAAERERIRRTYR